MTSSLEQRLAEDLDAAFPELLDSHGSLVATLTNRLADHHTREDLTQEVFLRAYRSLALYDAKRITTIALRPWLATIARNVVRNEARRRTRRPTDALDPHDGISGEDPAAGPAEQATAAEARDELDRLLAQLPPAQREAIVLRHVVGLTSREVALAMACPEGTAKSHVSRGLATLRAALGPTSPAEMMSTDTEVRPTTASDSAGRGDLIR